MDEGDGSELPQAAAGTGSVDVWIEGSGTIDAPVRWEADFGTLSPP